MGRGLVDSNTPGDHSADHCNAGAAGGEGTRHQAGAASPEDERSPQEGRSLQVGVTGSGPDPSPGRSVSPNRVRADTAGRSSPLRPTGGPPTEAKVTFNEAVIARHKAEAAVRKEANLGPKQEGSKGDPPAETGETRPSRKDRKAAFWKRIKASRKRADPKGEPPHHPAGVSGSETGP